MLKKNVSKQAPQPAGKTRVQEKTFLSKREASEVASFVAGEWFKSKPPAAIKNWKVFLDDEVESLELTAPVINLKKLKLAVDAADWGQALEYEMHARNPVTNAFEPVQALLVLFRGHKGHYPRHAGGLVTRDSIEACTRVPDRLRKKLFLLLPQCLNVK